MGINIEPKITIVPSASVMSATAGGFTYTFSIASVTLNSTDKLIVIEDHMIPNNIESKQTPHPVSIKWGNEDLTKQSFSHYNTITVGSSVWLLDGPSVEASSSVTIQYPEGESSLIPDGEGQTTSSGGNWQSPWNSHIAAYVVRGARDINPIVQVIGFTAADGDAIDYSKTYTTLENDSIVLYHVCENNNISGGTPQMVSFVPTPNYEVLQISSLGPKFMFVGGHTASGPAGSIVSFSADVTGNNPGGVAFTVTHFIEIASDDTPTSHNAEKFGERLLGDGANISWIGDSLTNPQGDDRLPVAALLECPVEINGVFLSIVAGIGVGQHSHGIVDWVTSAKVGGTDVVGIQYINQYASPQNNYFLDGRPFGTTSSLFNGYERQLKILPAAVGLTAVPTNFLLSQTKIDGTKKAYGHQIGDDAGGITPPTSWWPNTNFINDDSFSARCIYIEQPSGIDNLELKSMVANIISASGTLFGTSAATAGIAWTDVPIGKVSESDFFVGRTGAEVRTSAPIEHTPGATTGFSELGIMLWSPSAAGGVVFTVQSYGSSDIDDHLNVEHARDIDISKFYEACRVDTPILWIRDGFVADAWKTRLQAWIERQRRVHALTRASDPTIRPLLMGIVSTYPAADPGTDGQPNGAIGNVYHDQTKIAYQIAKENPDVFFVNVHRLVHEAFGQFATPTKGGQFGWGVLPATSLDKENLISDGVHPTHMGARVFMRLFFQEVLKQANKNKYVAKKNIIHTVPSGETAFNSFILMNHPGKYGQNNYIVDDIASIQKIKYSINSTNVAARLDIVMQGQTTVLQGMPGQNFGSTTVGNCLNIPDHLLFSLRRSIDDPGGEVDFTKYKGLKHSGVADMDGVIRVNPVGFTGGDTYILQTEFKF